MPGRWWPSALVQREIDQIRDHLRCPLLYYTVEVPNWPPRTARRHEAHEVGWGALGTLP